MSTGRLLQDINKGKHMHIWTYTVENKAPIKGHCGKYLAHHRLIRKHFLSLLTLANINVSLWIIKRLLIYSTDSMGQRDIFVHSRLKEIMITETAPAFYLLPQRHLNRGEINTFLFESHFRKWLQTSRAEQGGRSGNIYAEEGYL